MAEEASEVGCEVDGAVDKFIRCHHYTVWICEIYIQSGETEVWFDSLIETIRVFCEI